jgi:hypothetical protein
MKTQDSPDRCGKVTEEGFSGGRTPAGFKVCTNCVRAEREANYRDGFFSTGTACRRRGVYLRGMPRLTCQEDFRQNVGGFPKVSHPRAFYAP